MLKLIYLLFLILGTLCYAHLNVVIGPGQYLEIGGISCKKNDTCLFNIQVKDSNGNFQLLLNQCGSNDPRNGGVLSLGTYYHGTIWVQQDYDTCIQIYNMNLVVPIDVVYRIQDMTPVLQRQLSSLAISTSIATFFAISLPCLCVVTITVIISILLIRRKKTKIIYLQKEDVHDSV